MSDDFTDLENELKQLRPRAMPAPLIGRVAKELAEPSRRRGLFAEWRTWILPAAAAAALALTVTSIPFMMRERGIEAETAVVQPAPNPANVSAAAPTPARLHPVRATNVLYDAVNEGIVYLDEDTPAQRMRLSYLDTITWENPKGGASLQWTVPREEIYFVPVTAN
ncbi:MAG TPA: hypothetical protein VMM36_02000 [Opitutaceae bacterium]|nr:hypothetical protein [Opitutaceae bacterium]